MNRTLIEQFDPRREKAGGIDTCIRGLLKYKPSGMRLRVVGVDAIGDRVLGKWSIEHVDGREFEFMAVARLDHADLRRAVPHSVALLRGVFKFRRDISDSVVQAHRVNTGVALRGLFPQSRLVQFIHSSGVENLGPASRSFFKGAKWAYRAMEHVAVLQARDVVVFSSKGATRLQALSANVRFSPTWFDPETVYPGAGSDSTARTRLIWVGRLEPAKDPHLALEVLTRLPEPYSLTMVGSGTLEASVKSRVEALGLARRVTLTGLVKKSVVGEELRKNDLFLMTSHFEGFPRAMVEALGSGLPVVATDGADPNGLLDGRSNGVRTSREPAVLAHAIEASSTMTREGALASVHHLRADTVVRDVLGAPL
ncbi:glycosyltransferase [Geodermatophilus sp. URMC 63]